MVSYFRNTYIRDIYTRDAYVRDTYIKNICIKCTCNEESYIGNTSTKIVCMVSAYVGSTIAIEYLKIYLQSFQILKIRQYGIELKNRVEFDGCYIGRCLIQSIVS